jgi:hypothetical protein
MSIHRTIRFALVLLSLAAILLAAEVTGKWKGQIENSERDTIFTLKADGSNVTGSMSDPEGQGKERPLKGTVKGDDISFTVDSSWQGNPVKLLVKGTVAGDQMKLEISSEGGEWSTSLTVKRM